MSRHSEVQQGQKWLTNAAFDLLRQNTPTEAVIDAFELEKKIGLVAKRVTLTYSDDSAAGAAGTYVASIDIPAGCYLLDIVCLGVALWNAGTSAAMDVGDDDDPDGYYAAVNMKATDLLAGETLTFGRVTDHGKGGAYLTAAGRQGPITTGCYYATAKTITATITVVGTACTTGSTVMTVIYCHPKDYGVSDFTAA